MSGRPSSAGGDPVGLPTKASGAVAPGAGRVALSDRRRMAAVHRRRERVLTSNGKSRTELVESDYPRLLVAFGARSVDPDFENIVDEWGMQSFPASDPPANW